MLLDLDNTVLPYRPSPQVIGELAILVQSVLMQLPANVRIVMSTNTGNHPQSIAQALTGAGIRLIEDAGKPRLRRIRRMSGGDPTVVVGDQPLTDGFIAWRLGVPFILVPGCSESEPLWPKMMRIAGTLLLPLFFTPVRWPGG